MQLVAREKLVMVSPRCVVCIIEKALDTHPFLFILL